MGARVLRVFDGHTDLTHGFLIGLRVVTWGQEISSFGENGITMTYV